MQNRPNVLLISCHDLGQHLGCYGIETVDTPHIDRLAEQGVRFSRSFCVNPGCSPSRASLATGRYPHSHGVMGLTHGLFAWALHEGEVHLQARFEQAGYHTALLGVCHEVREPQKLGFSEYLRPTREHPEQARAMTLAASAEQFLAGRRDGAEPFYLQLGFFEPHREPGHPTHWPATHRPARRQVTVPPYLVDDAGAREELAYFEASVRTVDDAMGRILAALDENGLADDTLVIFTADHGIPFPRAKCSVYNPGLEVPLILRWPNGPWQAGAVLDELISNVDYLPTLCDLLDLPRADNHQGFSYAPLLRGRSQTPREQLFAELTYHDYYDPLRTIRTERYKLIMSFCHNKGYMDPSQQSRPKTRTVVPADHARARHPVVELYDLDADPLEQHDLADDQQHAAVRDDLLRRLHRWMIETEDPLLHGVPPSPMHGMALETLRAAGAGH